MRRRDRIITRRQRDQPVETLVVREDGPGHGRTSDLNQRAWKYGARRIERRALQRRQRLRAKGMDAEQEKQNEESDDVFGHSGRFHRPAMIMASG